MGISLHKGFDMSVPEELRLHLIEQNLEQIQPYIRQTPVMDWKGPLAKNFLGSDVGVNLKLEMLQVGGSFKPRGALTVLAQMDEETRKRGVIAASAGNHAISTAYAGAMLGANVNVVMPSFASPIRLERCREWGATIHLVESTHEAFETVERLKKAHGWSVVHPFEGPYTALGTATVALEWSRQLDQPLDAVVIPIGGGGLIAGMATAFCQIWPDVRVFGVEPYGADAMARSLEAGHPQTLEKVDTIADSLGAPFSLPYSFAKIRDHVERVVRIPDEAMKEAMRLFRQDLYLAPEPAATAAVAAIAGPLKETLAGLRTGAIVCGATIDLERFSSIIND